ncbi:hypothetical protein O181_065583 [Austropuccinia psidii MF-1]|uniref:Uncharacterized protein n=1 Tax=Austropuccinia psidii MF-1 TaxID=1389203 RepID=A0A9Q3EVL8_9BASI|nr:hypothetical protein [Austropuccinia psidii MF-1]
MRLLLRSKDLLDVCEKAPSANVTTPSANKWNKAGYNKINPITSKVNHCVFLAIANSETSDNAHLLWTKIKDQYTSKKVLKKGQVWVNWQESDYNHNQQVHIDKLKKLLLELDSVSIKVPLEIVAY